MSPIEIFSIIILIFSVVVHEVTHGLMADRLGDPTARLAGRLTMNPLKHLDPIGSVLVPGLLLLLPGSNIIIGWAKPVPFNPLNLKDHIKGGALIAIAGPVSNLVLALIFALLNKLVLVSNVTGIPTMLPVLIQLIVIINVSLAIFNLVPIAPLDGSKILYALLPKGRESERFISMYEQYGFIILILFLFSGLVNVIAPIIYLITNFLI